MCPESVVEWSKLHEIGAGSCYEHQIDLVPTKYLTDRGLAHALRLCETCSQTSPMRAKLTTVWGAPTTSAFPAGLIPLPAAILVFWSRRTTMTWPGWPSAKFVIMVGFELLQAYVSLPLTLGVTAPSGNVTVSAQSDRRVR